MTAYIDDADFASLGLPQSVVDRAVAKGIDPARHHEAASRWADGYLAWQYAVPLASWTDELREAVAARSGWTLLCAVGFNPESPADVAVRERADAAEKWCSRVRFGLLLPPGLVGA